MSESALGIEKLSALGGEISLKTTEVERLEPCGKPQAEEAARLWASDEACDEGVH